MSRAASLCKVTRRCKICGVAGDFHEWGYKAKFGCNGCINPEYIFNPKTTRYKEVIICGYCSNYYPYSGDSSFNKKVPEGYDRERDKCPDCLGMFTKVLYSLQ
jgi:hypothetical protein